MKVDVSPAEKQLLDLVRDLKRRKRGSITVEIENGMIRRFYPTPEIPALKDTSIDNNLQPLYTESS